MNRAARMEYRDETCGIENSLFQCDSDDQVTEVGLNAGGCYPEDYLNH